MSLILAEFVSKRLLFPLSIDLPILLLGLIENMDWSLRSTGLLCCLLIKNWSISPLYLLMSLRNCCPLDPLATSFITWDLMTGRFIALDLRFSKTCSSISMSLFILVRCLLLFGLSKGWIPHL